MDKEIRGHIEEQINSIYQKQSMLEGLDWILEVDKDMASFEDYAFGYFIGSIKQIVLFQAENLKFSKTIDDRNKKFEEKVKKNPKAKMPKIASKERSLTNEEKEEINDIVRRWVVHFREKLNKEIAVQNAKTKA